MRDTDLPVNMADLTYISTKVANKTDQFVCNQVLQMICFYIYNLKLFAERQCYTKILSAKPDNKKMHGLGNCDKRFGLLFSKCLAY